MDNNNQGDPKPNSGEGSGEGSFPAEDIKKLREQVSNLTKGIASYRDEAQSASKRADAAEKAAEALRKQIEDLSDNDEELALSDEDQQKLASWAKKQGFVSKAELEAEKQKIQQESFGQLEAQAVAEFLEKHPEYDNDENWTKLKAEFSQYKTPTSLQSYRNILLKIHTNFSEGSKNEDARAAAKAELINKGRLAIGGGSQKGGSDEHSVESLQKRYPNLSREQILARKAEIDALYPKK